MQFVKYYGRTRIFIANRLLTQRFKFNNDKRFLFGELIFPSEDIISEWINFLIDQIEFLKESVKTLDNMGFAIRNRLALKDL